MVQARPLAAVVDLVQLANFAAQVSSLTRGAVILLTPPQNFLSTKMFCESDEYEAEEIVDVGVHERTEEFLIKWKDNDA